MSGRRSSAPRSFDALFETYWGQVRRYAAHQFGEANAEDVAQEAMLRAYRSFHQLDAERPVWPWLSAITRHAGSDLMRTARRYVPSEIEALDAITPPSGDHPAVAAVAGDTRRRLGRAIGRLTERDRAAIQLFDVEGRPVAEIAALLGTTANTIRQRVFRARRHLLQEYEAVGGQPGLTGVVVGRAGARWRTGLARARRGVDAVPGWVRDHGPATASVAAALLLVAGPATTAPDAARPGTRGTTTATPVSGPVAGGLGAPRFPAPVVSALVGTVHDGVLGSAALWPYHRIEDCDGATRAFRSDCLGRPLRTSPAPPGSMVRNSWVRSADGTLLHARVLLPASHLAGQRHPVVLVAGPSFHDDVYPYPQLWQDGRIFDRGYAYVQVGLRGRGSSGGCADFGGPGEQADARAAVAWAASQPWSTGRVGIWGVAYDGWAATMALAGHAPGLAAAVVGSPITDLRAALYDGDVPYASSTWPVTELADAAALRGMPDDPRCDAAALRDLADPDPRRPYWRQRDLLAAAGRSRVPVLLSHGFADPVAPVAGSTGLLARLRGPVRAYLGQFVDGFPLSDDRGEQWFTEALAWLDYYVAGSPRPVPLGVAVEGTGPATRVRWRAETAWPPADAVPLTAPLLPGTYADLPGNCGSRDTCSTALASGSHVVPPTAGAGSWTFSQPLPYAVHLAGSGTVRLRFPAVRPVATTVCLLYDVAPDGHAVLVTRGAVASDRAAASVALAPQDWRFGAGHRLGLLLSGADDGWYAASHSGAAVPVEGVDLVLPFLRTNRAAVLETRSRPGTGGFPVAVGGRESDIPLPPRLR